MAKRVDMTRERKIALPIILAAARAHLAGHSGNGRAERELREALEKFDDR